MPWLDICHLGQCTGSDRRPNAIDYLLLLTLIKMEHAQEIKASLSHFNEIVSITLCSLTPSTTGTLQLELNQWRFPPPFLFSPISPFTLHTFLGLFPSCCHFPFLPVFLLCPQLPSLCFCKCHSQIWVSVASRGAGPPSELQNLTELFPTLFMNAAFTCLCADRLAEWLSLCVFRGDWVPWPRG